MIHFSCPGCSAPLQALTKMAGTTARCGGCGQLVTVPASGATPLPATALYAPPAVPLPPLPLPIPAGAALALPPDVNRVKIVAGCLGITLGFAGAHKFYLGRKWVGATMLALSGFLAPVVGLLATMAVWAIGITEGVLYLTRSDQEFHDNYIAGRREWF